MAIETDVKTATFLGVLLLAACAPADVPVPADMEPAAHWMTDDPAGWPRIAMINAIEYTDATHPSAACGFLLDTGGIST